MNLPWNGGKLLWYDGKLMCDFNPRKSRVKVTVVIYHGNLTQYFYNTGPRCQQGSQICFETFIQRKNHKIVNKPTTIEAKK